MYEIANFVQQRDRGARFSTAILEITWPCKNQGKFILRGTVPATLADTIFDTERDCIDSLLALGVTKFQRADCSWYEAA